ncbi:MAG: DUF1512 domain-containing protein [Nitrososphaeria archaeon]|nr:DUF1512 domain-containing protein [Nitrososphaeria archaeon]MDW8043642.1 DUF1512 domain-containing protein [Nitrososphaerota archaeon]
MTWDNNVMQPKLVLAAAPGTGQLEDSTLFMLFWFLFIMLSFFFYPILGQRMQLINILRDIDRKLYRLKVMRDDVRSRTIAAIKQSGNNESEEEIGKKLDVLLDYFYIAPESMDPYGVVYKLEHILNIGENRFEDQVASLVRTEDRDRLKTLTNLVEVARAMNVIYRVVRHYYLLGRKTANYFIALQIQMQLPIIMELAEAYRQASFAFYNGQPIGDGAGVLVAAKFAREINAVPVDESVKDTVVLLGQFEGRKVYVVRAKGPGGTVGRPGDAVKKVIETEGRVDLVVTIDAALKLEGEETGKVAEGVGVAIGGPGIDKFKIETIAKDRGVPLYAYVIFQSIGEAITPMKESIAKASDVILTKLKETIRKNVPENGTVVVAGIGNTVGIGM